MNDTQREAFDFWQRHGFEPYNTGGGCIAMIRLFGARGHILVTDDDLDVPQAMFGQCLVGFYAPGGEPLVVFNLAGCVEAGRLVVRSSWWREAATG